MLNGRKVAGMEVTSKYNQFPKNQSTTGIKLHPSGQSLPPLNTGVSPAFLPEGFERKMGGTLEGMIGNRELKYRSSTGISINK